MKRIAIVSGTPLSMNPRAVREGTILGRAGYQVMIFSPHFSSERSSMDRVIEEGAPFRRVASFDLRPESSGLRRFRLKLRRRVAMELSARVGIRTENALGYGLQEAWDAVSRESFDLIIGHQETGLWVASRALKSGVRAAVDMEDWYSQDTDDPARHPQQVLTELERSVLPGAAWVSAPSLAMAKELEATYALSRTPTVLYNLELGSAPPSVVRAAGAPLSVYWVSRNIGRNRGLDLLLNAARGVESPLALHLRGESRPEVDAQLRGMVEGTAHMLNRLPPIPASGLLADAAQHDVGVALEWPTRRNHAITITNKVLCYLQAGLAVLATDTPGQREAAALAPGAVTIIADEAALREQLRLLAMDREELARRKAAAARAAQSLCWEAQQQRLLDIVAVALESSPPCDAS